MWILKQTEATSLGEMYVFVCVCVCVCVCVRVRLCVHLLLSESGPPVNMAAITTVTEGDVIS